MESMDRCRTNPNLLGPGHDGSLIRGDASRPVYGVTLQRADQAAFETKWLSWIGPWQYQVFSGQLDDYQAVPNTKLIGMRLTAQPFSYLELGLSRVIQWGGKGRPNSLSSLWDAIGGSKDNIDDPNMVATDPSNQLAGVDGRLNLNQWTSIPISFYGQVIGEDEAGGLPSRKLYLAGIDYSAQINNLPYQLYAEWSDTRTNGEVKIIHIPIMYIVMVTISTDILWGMPWVEMVKCIQLGNIQFDKMNRVSGRILSANVNQSSLLINQKFPNKDEIQALELTWTHYIQPTMPLKINGWVSDSDLLGQDSGLSVGIELPLDDYLF